MKKYFYTLMVVLAYSFNFQACEVKSQYTLRPVPQSCLDDPQFWEEYPLLCGHGPLHDLLMEGVRRRRMENP